MHGGPRARSRLLALGLALLALCAWPAQAREPAPPTADAAETGAVMRIVVSVDDRWLWLLRGADTLLSVPAGVGTGQTLRYGERRWRFHTPRGVRRVIGKAADPVWTPPDWHYVEVARENGLELVWLERGAPVALGEGVSLAVRGRDAGLVLPDGAWEPLPTGEEIVFDGTLYAPPLGTRQRRVPGELGTHKLDLGDGYLIHGTRDPGSVGGAVSHGCVRLRNGDVARLYRLVPVGTEVEIR